MTNITLFVKIQNINYYYYFRWDNRQRKDDKMTIFINQEEVYGKLDTGRKVQRNKQTNSAEERKISLHIGGTGEENVDIKLLLY